MDQPVEVTIVQAEEPLCDKSLNRNLIHGTLCNVPKDPTLVRLGCVVFQHILKA